MNMRNTGDAALIGAGYLGTAAYYADVFTPILTAIMVLLSIIWMLWRMLDRVRHGPKGGA
ncbi:MAG: hypothetical protein WDA25_00940 [Paracoccaceae bacterium]